VDDHAADYDVAMVMAKEMAEERGATFINPCLGDTLLAGQGTVALEIIEDRPDIASIVTPVGGGGLLGGIGSFVRFVAPNVKIIGAQSVFTGAMAHSMAAGRVVQIDNKPTLADGLAGQIDDEALGIGRFSLDNIVMIEEAEIGATIAWLSRTQNVTAEGAGAVGVAAILHRKLPNLPTPAAVIVSGGNIDHARLAELLQ
jgi:threonine dehydratase